MKERTFVCEVVVVVVVGNEVTKSMLSQSAFFLFGKLRLGVLTELSLLPKKEEVKSGNLKELLYPLTWKSVPGFVGCEG